MSDVLLLSWKNFILFDLYSPNLFRLKYGTGFG